MITMITIITIITVTIITIITELPLLHCKVTQLYSNCLLHSNGPPQQPGGAGPTKWPMLGDIGQLLIDY